MQPHYLATAQELSEVAYFARFASSFGPCAQWLACKTTIICASRPSQRSDDSHNLIWNTRDVSIGSPFLKKHVKWRFIGKNPHSHIENLDYVSPYTPPKAISLAEPRHQGIQLQRCLRTNFLNKQDKEAFLKRVLHLTYIQPLAICTVIGSWPLWDLLDFNNPDVYLKSRYKLQCVREKFFMICDNTFEYKFRRRDFTGLSIMLCVSSA